MLNKLFSIFNRKKKVEVKVVSNIQKSGQKKKQSSEASTPSQTSDTIFSNPLHPLNPSSPIYSENDDYDQKPTRSSNPYSSSVISEDCGGKVGSGFSPSSGGGCSSSSGGGGSED